MPMFRAGLFDNRHQPLPLKAVRRHKVFSTPNFDRYLTIPMARLNCFNLKLLSRRRSQPSIAVSLLFICAGLKY